MLEKYDPSTSKFLHVSSTCLYESKDTEFTMKEDRFKGLCCFTNGKNLYMRHNEENKSHIFNTETGMQISSQNALFEADNDFNFSHNPADGQFYRFIKKNDYVKCQIYKNKAFEI